jgi:UDP-sugar pyrophosphorylase
MHAGDVQGPDGRSPFPGSINQIIIKLEPYVKQLDLTDGVIAEFVNPKYKDMSRTAFLKPTRLECMMQDYPKTLPSTEPVGFTSFLEVRADNSEFHWGNAWQD